MAAASRSAFRVALLSSRNVARRRFSTVIDETFAPISPVAGQSQSNNVLDQASNAKAPRNSWTKEDIRDIYKTPLMELTFRSVSFQCTDLSIDA